MTTQVDRPLVECESLVRIHQHGSVEVQALQGLDLVVGAGEMIAVIGPSGAGKSTLLSILAGADLPTAGSARVAGWGPHGADPRAAPRLPARRRRVRRQQTARNLVQYLTARGNVELPLALAGSGPRARRARADELLETGGVGHCADRLPSQMSGGEQQRTAIAVALANGPRLLLADEPTGELDSATAQEVFDTLRLAQHEAA